jgi:SAM-dependent methyltransferase
MRIPADDPRSPDQIRQHYEVERELAATLRSAPKERRMRLYAELYDQLYRRVPTHPQLTRKRSPEAVGRDTQLQLRFLGRFLKPAETFLEIGAGDCNLSFEVARRVRKAFALDVSAEIMKHTGAPKNCELLLSDGCSIPVPPASIHVAYSNQLMEHLHPDDALEQLRNIHRALVSGGRYVCITPNRLNGPHDVSQYFDDEACGFHMKEYTTGDLMRLYRAVGFRRVQPYLRVLGRYFSVPGWIPGLGEGFLGALPGAMRRALARRVPFRWLLGIQLIGIR